MNEITTTQHYGGTVELHFDPVNHEYYRMEDGEKILISGVTSVCAMKDKSGALTQWAANMTVEWLRKQVAGLWIPCATRENTSLLTLDNQKWEEYLNESRFNFRNIKEAAGDTGTIAHDWLEAWIRNKLEGTPAPDKPPENEFARNCVTAALDWFSKHHVIFHDTERKVYSLEHDYSGTMDLRMTVERCTDTNCCPSTGTVRVLADFKSSKDIYEEFFIQTAAYSAALREEYPEIEIDSRLILRLGKLDGVFEAKWVDGQERQEEDFDCYLGLLQVYNWDARRKLERPRKRRGRKTTNVRKVKDKQAPIELIPVGA